MADSKQVTFFLTDGLRRKAESGDHNFLRLVAEVLTESGFQVDYAHPDSAKPGDGRYALFNMKDPDRDRGLTFRRSYYYPFWQIERTNERWNWEVAEAEFDADGIDQKEAQRFYSFWQKRLFDEAPQNTSQDGFIYVPLQGRLLRHRFFQTCSPLYMVKQVLDGDRDRDVIATLHPKEDYSAKELQVLERLADAEPRLTLQTGGMEDLLPRCDYIVTQNSSVAFAGYFFGKPSVLFAGIDFHHIAARVSSLGVRRALQKAQTMRPDYAAYIWWFLQHRSINAGRPEAKEKIRNRLAALGWPV